MRSLSFLITTLWVVPVAAQRLAIAPAPSVLFTAGSDDLTPELSDSVRPLSRDPREVGAGLGAMLGIVAVYGLSRFDLPVSCEDAAASCAEKWHPGVRGYLVGAAAGGVTGYLLGRLIHGPYHRPELPPSSPHKDVGVKWWQGALVGAGVGAFAAPFLAEGLHWDKGGDGTPPMVFAPLGALVGFVVGGSSAQD